MTKKKKITEQEAQTKTSEEKSKKEENHERYRSISIEKFNTIVVVPNDTPETAYFLYDPDTGVFDTSKFKGSDFPDLELKILKKCLTSASDIIVESKILYVSKIDHIVLLIALFFALALYNNIFTFKNKEYNKVEVIPTVIIGLILVLWMISRGINYLFFKTKSNKPKNFEKVKEEISQRMDTFNHNVFQSKGYVISMNKNFGYCKLAKKNRKQTQNKKQKTQKTQQTKKKGSKDDW